MLAARHLEALPAEQIGITDWHANDLRATKCSTASTACRAEAHGQRMCSWAPRHDCKLILSWLNLGQHHADLGMEISVALIRSYPSQNATQSTFDAEEVIALCETLQCQQWLQGEISRRCVQSACSRNL